MTALQPAAGDDEEEGWMRDHRHNVNTRLPREGVLPRHTAALTAGAQCRKSHFLLGNCWHSCILHPLLLELPPREEEASLWKKEKPDLFIKGLGESKEG